METDSGLFSFTPFPETPEFHATNMMLNIKTIHDQQALIEQLSAELAKLENK